MTTITRIIPLLLALTSASLGCAAQPDVENLRSGETGEETGGDGDGDGDSENYSARPCNDTTPLTLIHNNAETCTVTCSNANECPEPPPSYLGAGPDCMHDGFSFGLCVLACEINDDCQTGAICQDDRCVWPS